MGKRAVQILIIIFVIFSLSLGFTLGIMNFDYTLIKEYQIYKEIASYSSESEYVMSFAKGYLNDAIYNILISLAYFMVSLAISIILLIKVYQLNSGKKTIQEINEIKIDKRIYYEGKIKGLTELLYLIEIHKDNVNVYGNKLIDFLEEIGYPNIVVDNEKIMDFVKDFKGSAKELSVFLENMNSDKEYHLIQKDTGKVTSLNMKSLIPMLNFVLDDYENKNRG